jgi:peptidase M28-like protein/PDZ domain-containing protein
MTATLLLGTLLALQTPPAAEVRRVSDDVRYLAADAREGRGVGTKGLEDAGTYIANTFRRLRLRPGNPDGSFFQPFTISRDAPAVQHTNLGGATTRNIVAVLPGRGPLRGQLIVIGAHYDHLGLGGASALDPDSTGKVHNGADDNASGTAALLEIARRLSRQRPARTIVFIAFSGEELGVLGSTYYVRNPLVQPVDSIAAMLNLDMVGRLRDRKLLALGAATAREFPALLDSLNRGNRFDLRPSGDGWGPSDHASFYAVKRPVLHFFTDLHGDYHRSTDDWEQINSAGIVDVAAFVADLGLALANRPGALTFVDAPRPTLAQSGRSSASLGTIPDMSDSPGGVRITGVRSGGPGELAGLQGGDIIIKIGDKAIANLYDMTDALNSHQPGDTVQVVLKRGDQQLTVTAVLGRRGG